MALMHDLAEGAGWCGNPGKGPWGEVFRKVQL